MRDVDRVAMELGLTLTRMMENAGANLASLASVMLGGEVSGRPRGPRPVRRSPDGRRSQGERSR
jgi:hypothetical protein